MGVVSTGRRFIWLSDLSSCIWTSVWPLIIHSQNKVVIVKNQHVTCLYLNVSVCYDEKYEFIGMCHTSRECSYIQIGTLLCMLMWGKMWSYSCPACCTCLTWRVFHTLCRFILVLKVSHVADVLCKVLEASGWFLWK